MYSYFQSKTLMSTEEKSNPDKLEQSEERNTD
jgi:hypothetical protein